jgi:hypothetical protein
MKVADLFPTRFIASADLNGKSFILTIRSVTLEDMQSHDNKTVTKPVAWFTNAAKGLVLNRTNCMIIADLHGMDTDDWVGKQIVIHATKVRAFGKMEDAIRVKPEIPPAQPKPTVNAAQAEEPSGLDDDDDGLDITLDPETGEIRSADEALWEPNAPVTAKPNRLSPAQMTRLNVLGVDVHGKRWDAERPQLVSEVTNGAATSCKELTPDEATLLIRQLEAELKHARNGVHA